jgi:phospholipid-binding lipoprotein MlaA
MTHAFSNTLFEVFRGLIGRLMLMALAAVALSACATRPPASDAAALAAYQENNDSLEPFNRSMLKVDDGVKTVLVRPILKGYRAVVPEQGRKSVVNFMHNLQAPITFVHDVLQGNIRRAGETVGRLVLNTGMGFFGFFDVAAKMGIPYHSEDFGQTLAVWGVGEGPYIYVPLFGPSTVRDGLGLAVDTFLVDPLAWYSRGRHSEGWVAWTDLGVLYVSAMDDNIDALDELRKSSIDYYSALRSAYRQVRNDDIRNGAPPPLEDFDDPKP